jgi:hypothetical protein
MELSGSRGVIRRERHGNGTAHEGPTFALIVLFFGLSGCVDR